MSSTSKVTTEDARSLRVSSGFQLSDVDPSSTPGFDGDDDDLDRELHQHDDELKDLQSNLWANATFEVPGTGSVLLIVQGMDTSGKGGLLRRVVQPFHPLGVNAVAFGAPTEEEASHDFLWRIKPHLPEPGHIVAFDRSHYEDVLIQRVEGMADPEEIERRYGAIVDFENEIAASGTKIIKVMLHISREFQAENLLDRINRPEKRWKYQRGDLETRAKWEEYMEAYQIAMERTSTNVAPWYCIPGDNKDYARTVVKHLMVDELRRLKQHWPDPGIDPEEEKDQLANT